MDVALLLPVKAFTAAKQRLSPALTAHDRAALARWMADRVVHGSPQTSIYVVCDDPDVRAWALDAGVDVVWTEGLGLDGAVDDGVLEITRAGFDHVVISHADLPLATRLGDIARLGTTTFVPDRRRDGTNVMSFPTTNPVSAAYGPASFTRHLARAMSEVVEVRVDIELALDIDVPSDLTHPLISEVLPSWLPTIPANRFTHHST